MLWYMVNCQDKLLDTQGQEASQLSWGHMTPLHLLSTHCFVFPPPSEILFLRAPWFLSSMSPVAHVCCDSFESSWKCSVARHSAVNKESDPHGQSVAQNSSAPYCTSSICCVFFRLNSQERHGNWLYLICRWVCFRSDFHMVLSLWLRVKITCIKSSCVLESPI